MLDDAEILRNVSKDIAEVLKRYGYPNRILTHGGDQVAIGVEITVRNSGILDSKSVRSMSFVSEGVRQ